MQPKTRIWLIIGIGVAVLFISVGVLFVIVKKKNSTTLIQEPLAFAPDESPKIEDQGKETTEPKAPSLLAPAPKQDSAQKPGIIPPGEDIKREANPVPKDDKEPKTPLVVTPFTAVTSTVEGLEIATFQQKKLSYKVRRLKLDVGPRNLRLAVTPRQWDDIGQLLKRLGEGFDYTPVTMLDLQTVEQCQKFDVIFLTCNDTHAIEFDNNLAKVKKVAMALKKFVEKGGTLYASDRRFSFVMGIFPEFRSAKNPLPGAAQTVQATIVDPGLKEHLEINEIPLRFDLGAWVPAEFHPKKTTTILKGFYRTMQGQFVEAPLLVKFSYKAGNVIFTSFHNEKQVSNHEKKLLEYLVFSTVNAKAESQIKAIMKENGFDDVKIKSTQLANDKAILEDKIEHKAGRIQIGIGFENLGGILMVTARSPKGEEMRHTENGTFFIEIADAIPGLWQFKVEATKLPFANFPVILSFGSGI